MKKIILVITCFILLTPFIIIITASNNDENSFILPSWAGGMVHSDPQLTDYIRLPAPRGDVKILWHKNELKGEQAGAKGNGIAGNGEIAACSFFGKEDNIVIYDYDGNRIWSSKKLLNPYTLFSTPMVDIHGRIIACDNKVLIMVDPFDYDSDGKIVEWISEIPYGGLPLSPVITEDGTIILGTDEGPIYAYDVNDGSLLAWKFIGKNDVIRPLFKILKIKDPGYFSTINTPCVKGNRIYISTMYKSPKGVPTFLHHARLYAIDVDVKNPNAEERLKEAWYYEFGGKSQASPTIINDTLYFHGYRPKASILRDPHLFAIIDKGACCEEKWKVPYPFPTYASFTYDPRGGVWYVDPWGGNIIRFSTDNGEILDKIIIDDLVQENGRHLPSSVMTMCGNDTNPMLILSATALRPVKANSYVIAIDLAANNSLLWKVKVYSGPLHSIDLGFGQYTILMKDEKPRIVFGSFSDGVWALGN